MVKIFLIFFAFLTIFICKTISVKLLVMGDSLDRNAYHAFHTYQTTIYGPNETILEPFSRYFNETMNGNPGPSTVKDKYYNQMTFVHMFGSPDHGPYLHNTHNTPTDPNIDTLPRINLLLQEYKIFYGSPDIISMQFAVWDCFLLLNKNIHKYNQTYINQQKEIFETNYIHRIQQVLSFLSPNKTELILRTAAATTSGTTLIVELNDIIRKIAKQYNLIVYDFHLDIWSTVQYNTSYINELNIFMDHLHVRFPYSVLMAKKQLRQRFTQSIRWQNHKEKKHQYERLFYDYLIKKKRPDYFTESHRSFDQPVVLVGLISKPIIDETIESLTLAHYSKIYLYHEDNHSLHEIPIHTNNTIFEYLRLGPLDVFPLYANNAELFRSIPLGDALPYFPSHSLIVSIINHHQHQSSSDTMVKPHYLFYQMKIRPITQKKILLYLRDHITSHDELQIPQYLFSFFPSYFHFELKEIPEQITNITVNSIIKSKENSKLAFRINEYYHRQHISVESIPSITPQSNWIIFPSIFDLEIFPLDN